jgi:hypothetical protein
MYEWIHDLVAHSFHVCSRDNCGSCVCVWFCSCSPLFLWMYDNLIFKDNSMLLCENRLLAEAYRVKFEPYRWFILFRLKTYWCLNEQRSEATTNYYLRFKLFCVNWGRGVNDRVSICTVVRQRSWSDARNSFRNQFCLPYTVTNNNSELYPHSTPLARYFSVRTCTRADIPNAWSTTSRG